MDARVNGQGQRERQPGVAGSKGHRAGSRVNFVAAENAVLDVVEGEGEAAHDVTVESFM